MEYQYWELGEAIVVCDEEHANIIALAKQQYTVHSPFWRIVRIENIDDSCAKGAE